MSGPEAGTGVRERDERDARFFAWDVPGDAHVVALVHEAGEAERSATVADAIATSVARRREHTLLLSAEAGPSPLDELLGASGSKGLPAALEGRVRLTDVAVQRVDRPFVYLPGGADTSAMRSLLEDDVLASFVDRVRERGGTLFIVLSAETLEIQRLRGLVDGYVALGDVALGGGETGLAQFGRVKFDNGEPVDQAETGEVNRIADVPGLPPLPGEVPENAAETAGHVEEATPDTTPVFAPSVADVETPPPAEPEPEPTPPEVTAEETTAADAAATAVAAEPDAGMGAEPPEIEVSDSWQRHRTKSGFPVQRVGIAAAGLIGIVAAWWFFAGGFGSSGDSTGDGPLMAGAGTIPVAGAQPTAEPPPETTPAADPDFDAIAAAAAFDEAPALGFSVMIASFNVAGDAVDRLAEIMARDDGFFFIAPTPVRETIYHRLLAGGLNTRGEAQALMDELVASGIKSEAGAWHLRPAALAFDLGLYSDRPGATARVGELRDKGIPAYALSAPVGDGDVWRVYGGAYVDEREAGPMGQMLDSAGEPAELVERRGVVTR